MPQFVPTAIAAGNERAIAGSAPRGLVVDEEGHVVSVADRHQALACTAHGVVPGVLEPELDASDVARLQRFTEPIGEGLRLETRRGDEVEAAALSHGRFRR